MKTKNIILIIALVGVIAVKADAQTQPPNAGFENWVAIGPYQNPVGWSSFNNFYTYGVPEMSFKTTDKNSGTYAVRLTSDTATVPPPLGTGLLDTLAGFVFLGSPDFSNPGIPYTDRPTSMQAYVKGTIIPGGNAILMATLRKWNTSTHARDQVGGAMYNMTSSVSTYTQISVPFNYTLPDIPDTLEIKIMAGDVGPNGFIMPGNEFFVDDISFTFQVGINETVSENNSINVYPNPVIDKLNIEIPQKTQIEILNLQGQEMKSLMINAGKSNISVATLTSGIYFIKIITGNEIEIKKFVKD